MDNTPTLEEANQILAKLVGSDATLRPDQWSAIEALVSRREKVLVVERTGWGKSAVYFVATALLRARGAGPSVIISPLLSLMRNQVSAAERAGIRASTVNSSNTQDWDEVHEHIRAGEVDVLLVSPERLNNPQFRKDVLPSLAKDAGLLVVDEAHCISDWGHDFRPDYRRITTLIHSLPQGVPVLATTATANNRVTEDILTQLSSTPGPVTSLRGPLGRDSLHLAVETLDGPARQLAWLSDSLERFDGSGIIYCLTVSSADQVTSFLSSRGFPVRSYSGQSDPAERLICEEELLENKVKALVATSALGMGFDKPDLSFVVHLGAPSSPVSYYQQVGRAGRATDRADVYLLPTLEERALWQWYSDMSFPPEKTVRKVINSLGEFPLSSVKLEGMVDLKRSQLELMLKVLDVEDAIERVPGGWVRKNSSWSYDRARYERLEQARLKEQDLMDRYEKLTSCRMAFLRSTLDDPEMPTGWTCGVCDNCAPRASFEVSTDALEAAESFLSKMEVTLEPRRQWAPSMSSFGLQLSGKIPETQRHEPGLALARLDSVGASAQLREVFSSPDAALPASLAPKVTKLLEHYRGKVDAVLLVESATRPLLVGSLSRGAAKILGVPLVGSIGFNPSRPSRHEVNSTQRLADVARRLNLNLSPAAREGLPGKRVLLIDDIYRSGWSASYAAKLLREEGAASVELFTLARG